MHAQSTKMIATTLKVKITWPAFLDRGLSWRRRLCGDVGTEVAASQAGLVFGRPIMCCALLYVFLCVPYVYLGMYSANCFSQLAFAFAKNRVMRGSNVKSTSIICKLFYFINFVHRIA